MMKNVSDESTFFETTRVSESVIQKTRGARTRKRKEYESQRAGGVESVEPEQTPKTINLKTALKTQNSFF
jgi:hypothetical protein